MMRAVVALLLLLLLGAPAWAQGQLEIHHIDVGQADSTLIVGPTGRTLLVDLGETGWNSHKNADKVSQYLLEVLGQRYVDYFVLTHFHADHCGYASNPAKGGIRYLLEELEFETGTVYDRGFDPLGTTSGTYQQWVGWVENLENHAVITRDTRLDLGPGVEVEVVCVNANGLLPGDRSHDKVPPSENDFSVCLKISYGKFDYFIGGDLSGETVMSSFGYEYHDIETHVAPLIGDVEIYKANHHGSGHSSNATFVEVLDPEVSVISCGFQNRFGHPDPAVLQRLLDTGDVYQTPEHGNIVVATDGQTYTVTSENTAEQIAYQALDAGPVAAVAAPAQPFPRGGSPGAPAPREAQAGGPPAYVLVHWGAVGSGGAGDLAEADGNVMVLSSRAGDDTGGRAVLEWWPVLFVEKERESMVELTVELDVAGPAGSKLEWSLYDFAHQRWLPFGESTLEATTGSLTLKSPFQPEFMSPQGRVVVRLRTEAASAFTIRADRLRLTPRFEYD